MNHWRRCKRLWLLVLVLVAGSLHVQTVYACSAMGERLLTSCCCEEVDSRPCNDVEPCDSGHSSAQICCEVSYSAGFDAEAVVTPPSQPEKSDAGPLALAPTDPAVLPIDAGPLARDAVSSFDGGAHSPIYLTTRRLRI